MDGCAAPRCLRAHARENQKASWLKDFPADDCEWLSRPCVTQGRRLPGCSLQAIRKEPPSHLELRLAGLRPPSLFDIAVIWAHARAAVCNLQCASSATSTRPSVPLPRLASCTAVWASTTTIRLIMTLPLWPRPCQSFHPQSRTCTAPCTGCRSLSLIQIESLDLYAVRDSPVASLHIPRETLLLQ